MLDHLSIVVVEQDRDRAFEIVDALQGIGLLQIKVIGDPSGLARKIKECDPDVVLIDLSLIHI